MGETISLGFWEMSADHSAGERPGVGTIWGEIVGREAKG